ncbi:SDR family oxidoreductase [Phenylobacterium sp. LjRoot219]|uniref:SDR family NAD(P)-dependent oxidoreductase n=1 Tax=Phenylobacterium sp. LjRoot219 TaxID=3342283 RepID=UPI003ED14873
MANPQGLFDLTGKKALVTGGNSGLGLGFARGLAKQGADVMIWARSEEKNCAAEVELRQYGGEVLSRALDVASEDAVVRQMQEAAEAMGRLDCVIANAGVSSHRPSILDLDSKTYHDLLNINLHGAFYTLREAARHMVIRAKAGDPGGSIIVCGSLSVYLGVPGLSHYAAAKGALASMMRSMAVELGPFGVRVNMVAPGYIKTDLGRHRGQASAGEGAEASPMDKRFIEHTPMKRVGYPQDFEAITAYLASDGAAFHTGDVIVIDGGYMVNV